MDKRIYVPIGMLLVLIGVVIGFLVIANQDKTAIIDIQGDRAVVLTLRTDRGAIWQSPADNDHYHNFSTYYNKYDNLTLDVDVLLPTGNSYLAIGLNDEVVYYTEFTDDISVEMGGLR